MRYMRPIAVSVEVPYPREEVYDFLDVMAHHESLMANVAGAREYARSGGGNHSAGE